MLLWYHDAHWHAVTMTTFGRWSALYKVNLFIAMSLYASLSSAGFFPTVRELTSFSVPVSIHTSLSSRMTNLSVNRPKQACSLSSVNSARQLGQGLPQHRCKYTTCAVPWILCVLVFSVATMNANFIDALVLHKATFPMSMVSFSIFVSII